MLELSLKKEIEIAVESCPLTYRHLHPTKGWIKSTILSYIDGTNMENIEKTDELLDRLSLELDDVIATLALLRIAIEKENGGKTYDRALHLIQSEIGRIAGEMKDTMTA